MKPILGVFMMLLLASCGGSSGGSGGGSTADPTFRVLASNVVMGTANASVSKSAAVNTTTKVLASNVELATSTNRLSSTNLQSALDDEMAVDYDSYLPGTTWTIVNKTTDPYYGTTGQVTWSANSVTLTGSFAAAGLGKDASLNRNNLKMIVVYREA